MRRWVHAALFVALGLILPALFHLTGLDGRVFLPMHIPVLLGGLLIGPEAGLAVGLVTPLLSGLLTGMPPIASPIMPMMIAELGAYGLITGWLARRQKGVLLPLLGGILAGRAVLFLAAAVAFLFGFRPGPVPYIAAAFMSSLPGLAVQLLLIPAVARLVRRATAPPADQQQSLS